MFAVNLLMIESLRLRYTLKPSEWNPPEEVPPRVHESKLAPAQAAAQSVNATSSASHINQPESPG